MKTTSILLALLILAGVLSTARPSCGQDGKPTLPRIRVEGNRFADPSGKEFVFRGVAISDPDKLEKSGHWKKSYFEAVKNWNCNIVRFPVHPSAWRERGEEKYLKLLDQGIAWAGELGMYVMIDWHSIGNLRTEVFHHPMYITSKGETLRFWRTIAERYARNPVVACYELFNEPTVFNGRFGKMSWEQHKELMEDIISIIYAYDEAAIPLVAGLNWGYDISYVRETPIGFPGIAYVTHPYPQKREQPWEEKWEQDFGFVAAKFPVVATEFGFMGANEPGAHIPVMGDETYGEAIISYLSKKGISWVAWCFDPDWAPQLIQNWNFEPTRQGRFFRDKMMQLNQAGVERNLTGENRLTK